MDTPPWGHGITPFGFLYFSTGLKIFDSHDPTLFFFVVVGGNAAGKARPYIGYPPSRLGPIDNMREALGAPAIGAPSVSPGDNSSIGLTVPYVAPGLIRPATL